MTPLRLNGWNRCSLPWPASSSGVDPDSRLCAKVRWRSTSEVHSVIDEGTDPESRLFSRFRVCSLETASSVGVIALANEPGRPTWTSNPVRFRPALVDPHPVRQRPREQVVLQPQFTHRARKGWTPIDGCFASQCRAIGRSDERTGCGRAHRHSVACASGAQRVRHCRRTSSPEVMALRRGQRRWRGRWRRGRGRRRRRGRRRGRRRQRQRPRRR